MARGPKRAPGEVELGFVGRETVRGGIGRKRGICQIEEKLRVIPLWSLGIIDIIQYHSG
jgi:hypothetical protein